MQREEYMTVQKAKSSVEEQFVARVADNKEKEDAKTAKKRLKRQKMKANKKKPKTETVEKIEPSESESDECEEKEVVELGSVKTDEDAEIVPKVEEQMEAIKEEEATEAASNS